MFNISPAAKPSTQFRIFSPFDQDAWRDSTQTAPSPKYKNCFESGSWRWNLFEEKTKSRRLFRPDFVNKNNSQSRSTKGKDPNGRFTLNLCRRGTVVHLWKTPLNEFSLSNKPLWELTGNYSWTWQFRSRNRPRECFWIVPTYDGQTFQNLKQYFSRNKMWNELSKAFQFPIRDFIFDSSEHLKESFDSKLLNTILPLLNPLISTLHKPDDS